MTYFSKKEIEKSYNSLRLTFDYILDNKEKVKYALEEAKEVIFIGCGSSYWACLSASRSFMKHTSKRATAYKGTELAMGFKDDIHLDNPLFIIATRSGETIELIKTLEWIRKEYPDNKVISISEYPNNKIADMSDISLSIPWADEKSVCQTRSFLNLLLAMYVLINEDEVLISDIKDYLDCAEMHYKNMQESALRIVDRMSEAKIVTLGSGINYGSVIEGAYIITEMAAEVASFYQTLEYRHGPIVTCDENTYIFLCNSKKESIDDETKMLKEAREHMAKTVICSCSEKIHDVDEYVCLDKEHSEEVKGLFFTSFLQHIAHYLAIKLGKDPDKPGDLVKYITY